MDVTALQADDRQRWTEMWGEYLTFYHTTFPDDVYEHTWLRLLNDTGPHAYAARIDGRIVGITHYLFHSSCWTLTPVCYLQDLFVDAAARGQGVGRALIEAVAARARAQDATRMYWLTQDDNATARLLYDRLAKTSGFIRYEYPI